MSGLREVSRCIRQMPISSLSRPAYQSAIRRCASTQAAPAEPAQAPRPEFADLEPNSSINDAKFGEGVKQRPPKDRYFRRKQQLPGSRYQYHPPKFDRGPLHPIQSPPSSDPVARDFVPGPYNIPRLRQTYETTIESDLMTLAYQHKAPGEIEPAVDLMAERLREWDGSSPYHKNRPKRGPRGKSQSRLAEPEINFNNVPEITEITLASYSPQGIKDEMYLWVARAMLQSVTGAVPELTTNKTGVAQWGVVEGRYSGAKVTVRGNAAYEWLDKCVHIVFPRIKEWPGVKGTSGDSQGNIAWGFTAADMANFPEIDTNMGMYPPKTIPGCRVFVKTTAKSTRHARLLLQSLGVPFYGKLAY